MGSLRLASISRLLPSILILSGAAQLLAEKPPPPNKMRNNLISNGITDTDVLDAFDAVPRIAFLPPALQNRAEEDRALPIGYEQTISQPSLVGYMTQCLALNSTDRVLEIGTGSGYQAAILAKLVDEVYTIEIIKPLAERATQTLAKLNIANVQIRIGDGYQGWPEYAPFDAIIVTCAPDRIPEPLVDQLKEGGRMIIPVGEENEVQQLVLLEKKAGKVRRTDLLDVRFVPMTRSDESAEDSTDKN